MTEQTPRFFSRTMMNALKLFFLVLTIAGTAAGQDRMMMRREQTFGEPVFCEIHTVMADADTAEVSVLYKFTKDLITFSRPVERPDESFHGSAEVAVEILDSAGTSITRAIRQLSMETADNREEFLRTQFCEGLTTFRLPKGNYTVLLQITDLESRAHVPDVRRPLKIRDVHPAFSSDLIAVLPKHDSDSSYPCFALGGDILFSQDAAFIVALPSSSSDPVLRYSLKKYTLEDEDETTSIVSDTTVQCTFFRGMRPAFRELDGKITVGPQPDQRTTMAVIPIRTIDLRQGSYELRITADTASLRTRFRTRWLDMPRMLRDLDLALLPLQYIMTEDQYAAMNDGGRRERIEKFDAFWRKKDPTPGTAYNEMLAEFYKRADHAMSAYRTLKEFNGAMTDRGKIFILYGKPTSTERSLRPGDVPKEIWVYATLKKTFVFEDPSRQGNYKLAESR